MLVTMILVDTNVLSELLRPEPAKQVERWLSAQDGAKVYFTTVGEGELRHGVALLPAGKRRNSLITAIEGKLATRNTSDFEGCGVELIDPWTFSARQ